MHVCIDETKFKGFVDDMLPRVSDMLDIPTYNYSVTERDSGSIYASIKHTSNSLFAPEYRISFNQYKEDNSAFISGNYQYDKIYIDGKLLQVCKLHTDEEIIASLEDVKNRLFTVFGVSFKDTEILRSVSDPNDITVYFYNKDGHPMNTLIGGVHSDYIRISFSPYGPNGYNEDPDYVSDSNITYRDYRDDAPSELKVICEAETISLAQAEELLFKGYVFGGQYICPICEKPNEAVDFSEYDAVRLVNYFYFDYEAKAYTFGVPFYRFFKLIGQGDGSYTYAATYVPAIKVADIEEYFEEDNLHQKHLQ